MKKRVAVITGYSSNPDFVQVLLKALNKQVFMDFECFIYACPGCVRLLDKNDYTSCQFPCHHIILKQNKGFAGNNNYLLNMVFAEQIFDYAVLINDDTIPDDYFLKELINSADADPNAGAVASKIVFYQPFINITGYTSTTPNRDGRKLGVRFYQNTRFENSQYNKRFLCKGFGHPEQDEFATFHWTDETFNAYFPIGTPQNNRYVFRLFIGKNPAIINQRLTLKIGSFITRLDLQENKLFYEFEVPQHAIDGHSFNIIQNAGSVMEKNQPKERGFGEKDSGQYDKMEYLDMFCGAACLIKRETVENSGLFLEGYFSYYEDSELSLRIRKKGYEILYNPKALVRHYHTGSSKEWSPFFTYYALRNKIIFSWNVFGWAAFLSAFFERLRETLVTLKPVIQGSFGKSHIAAIKFNLVILKDALSGITRFKIKHLTK